MVNELMSNEIALLAIFLLSIFVGFEVVSKVSTTLHTPLMSGANAIHGVIGICFILALKGLSSPKSARKGNLIGALGATIATVIVFFYANDGKALNNQTLILAAIGFGVLVGVPAARKVQMTQMPQLVALFNGVGGGAAALVAIVEYLKLGDEATVAVVVATVFTVIVGCVSFSGSIITFLKLQELMTTRPVVFPFGRQIIALTLIGVLISGGWVIASGGTTPLLINGLLSLIFGVLFVLPVGGADVPIVISLLNAFTGLTVAASGYVLQTTLLIIAGTLVGASLADLLSAKGVDVAYGIHPVAGRMPGHMNVLLAEANVPYEQLVEMEEINPTFPQTDVVLVVGANDVVNPAAKTTPGCPIYGMPILDVSLAANVIFLKRSMRPGFAGIENELLYEAKTTLLFGDAKDSLTKVVSALKAL